MRDRHGADLDAQQVELLPTREALGGGLTVAPVTLVGVSLALNVLGNVAQSAVAQAVSL